MRDVFAFASAVDSVVKAKRDSVYDFVFGIDNLNLSKIDANAVLAGISRLSSAGP